MKLAILLFGMSKAENHKNSKFSSLKIDYRKSYKNYEKFIFNYFKKLGYDIDFYLATNELSEDDKKELIETFKPVGYKFCKTLKGNSNYEKRQVNRNEKFMKCVELCMSQKIKYDQILITRFDLLFQRDFHKSNIKLNALNLVSTLEKSSLICDNFYLFSAKFLSSLYNVFNKFHDNKKSFHYLLNYFRKAVGANNINFIYNERKTIENLSFYKIHREGMPITKK
tara:strand:- start:6349 stop:7023 length:675 start_codon:yes stop_codon:yes gene_type:complete